ncbi:indole-3-acetaldehyde oxidase-like [Aristolochia californica]|uniref:indole-3-acetaldehyde oxidase-like n=1 Tax=Aristolochia californica TaxID=171875 RepID=UPI0035D76809
MERRGKLVFAVNGERFELEDFDPSTTLLEFLRTETRYKGVKLGCGEGGCGACVVLLSKYDPVLDQVEDFNISSCITLLISINGCSVTTSEGLGNSKDGFHSIHERFSGFFASQCGFCTPGMCMSLFSKLVDSDKTHRPGSPAGFSKLKAIEAESAVSGNLCRCTGYRPILDACKSFAHDVDMEDLGLNTFWRKDQIPDVNKLPLYSPNAVSTFPDFLKNEIGYCDSKNAASGTSVKWFSPTSLKELYSLLETQSESGYKVRLFVGNTSSGVYHEQDIYDVYIDLRQIPELLMIRRDGSGVEVGAGVTISKLIRVLKEGQDTIFKKIADHMSKVASEFVRNSASLGGNLILAQRDKFPSDIATILLASGSSITIYTGVEKVTHTLEEFLNGPSLDSKVLLLSIYIPSQEFLGSSLSEGGSLLFETYRAASRPLGNALAYLNAAFLAQISTCGTSGDHILQNLRLAFGAYGTKHAIRARKVEEFLIGKHATVDILLEGIKLLKATVIPDEGTTSPAYRMSLAVGFLFSFLFPILNQSHINKSVTLADNSRPSEGHIGITDGSIDQASNKDYVMGPASLISSKQAVEVSTEYLPVGELTKKVAAEIQASGEAVYVDDIPSPKDCLHGAFICSKRPLVRVKGFELKPGSASKKVVTVITSKDIPESGANIGAKSMFGGEPLFADDHTLYAGQPVGFLIAETQRYANMAASQAIVDYDTGDLGPPILTVEEAVERSSFFETPSFLCPKPVGDFSNGMEEAEHRILSEVKLGSQYYFYMETQTALAIPDEDNCMIVYSSNQSPENAQGVIASCLGIPYHNVRVITRRVGGGFGGKAMRAVPVATACALAAYKLQRPVRAYLDRRTDMIMAGGRHPMKINYNVGFRSDGKITALHVGILINAGISEDISPIMPSNLVGALKKYNWGALSFDIKICKTNHSSKSAMRGPGEVQGSYIAECIIEHVASNLLLDADSIRKKNLHTFESLQMFYEGSAGEAVEYTLPMVLDKLAVTSSFQPRILATKQFNSCSKWKKRGISCVPIVHEVLVRPTPAKVGILNDGSIVVEVGGIELGQGLWTKVTQMTAFALGQLWEDGSQDLLGRVRVVQADTLSLVQGGFTAGSTTSESSCEAARISCKVLVDRLMPLKEKLQEQMSELSWDSLISQAFLKSVNLSASTYWVPDYSSMKYLNYGAAISEVETDLLTGATTILQTDITYDCGQSLNPAVDVGQVEGGFVQGLGFFMFEEYSANSEGFVLSEGTWTYKIPTVDTIPRHFNVELLNSGHHQKRVLSSKASGEPPLLLAASVHCATREAIREARKELFSLKDPDESSSSFHLDVPATMPVVKELCGLDNVERYLESLLSHV